MAEKPRQELDALELLMQDHREVESLFREFEYLQKKGSTTAGVIDIACAELKMHDTVENDVFYPAVSKAAAHAEETETLLDAAEDAHDAVMALIDDLDAMDTNEARNAQFMLIIKNVQEHVAAEEATLFPTVRKLPLDLVALSAEMKRRKSVLMSEVGVDEANAEAV